MPRLNRPIYILAHPADNAGCGHHRVMRPVEILAKHGYASGRCDMSLWMDDRLKALAPDVILWQRQFEDTQIEAMRLSREAVPSAFHVYELDDCMSAIPDWSPHQAFIPHGVEERMAVAVSMCDAVSVSTRELADHMRSACAPGTDIRVVPNMLAKEELDRVEEIRSMRPPGRGKLRVGWGGSHSHKGDLDLLLPAMRELHNRMEFVFLGYCPESEVPVEFHQGVPPGDFLPRLASLELDLIIAPLVDCKFNRCKSNLRLLEAGALGVPVIASPVAPYMTNTPPVFYAEDERDWTVKLTEFLDNPDKFRARGPEMQRWMKRSYIMDEHLEERLKSWLPASTKPFVPKRRNASSGIIIVSSAGKRASASKYSVVKTLREACENTSSDIVYIRPGTAVSDDQIDRLMRHLNQGNTASVVPLSNDGGVAGFPRPGQFVPVDVARFKEADEICRKLFAPVQAKISNPAGPAMVLSRRVMEVCGYPDLDEPNPEAALVEWGVMVAAKGFVNSAVADTYVTTTMQHGMERLPELLARCQLRYPIEELPPDPLAEVRQELELVYHKEIYKAALPSSNASYAEWSALFNYLSDDDLEWMNSHFPDVKIKSYTFPVLRDQLLDDIKQGTEWAVLTAASSALAPHAPYIFAKAIADAHSESGCGQWLFYADHDFRMQDGSDDRHDFKPSRLDTHLLYQRDYITPVFAVHLPTLFELDSEGVPDLIMEPALYGLVLDMVENLGESAFCHVPRVLAHLVDRQPAESIENSTAKALEATKRLEVRGVKVAMHPRYPFLGLTSYAGAVPQEAPLVSIIMPTGGKTEVISPCISSLLKGTDYPNFELIVVENGVINPACHEYLEGVAAKDPRVKLLYWSKGSYNWSAINNWAANKCQGEYLLLLNDDTRILYANWLKEMVGGALQPNVGAVGARLIYPHGFVQHVGVVCRAGLCGHLDRGVHEHLPGYNGIAVLSHQATAVTGACMLISRQLYQDAGKLNEDLAHNYNDVALCLELERLSYHNLVVASAELHHIEGVTRHKPDSNEGVELLMSEGLQLQKLYPEPDPYWNDNLFFQHSEGGMFVSGLNSELMAWPATPWEHRGTDWPRETILMLGDDGSGWVAEARKGNVVYFAVVQGFGMQIVRPTLGNVQPFDVRESMTPQMVLQKLGITKVLVRSILGGGVETLPFIVKLGLPIEYRPITNEAVCPRLDFKALLADGEFGDCQEGWKRGLCQKCLVTSGSPFGVVSIAGWRDQWHRFFQSVPEISATTEETARTTREMYPEVEQEARAAAE